MPYKRRDEKVAEAKELEKVKEEAPVEKEEPKKETNKKSKSSVGKVVGGSLNLRKEKGGEILSVLAEGINVEIADSSDPDWYKIKSPKEGWVMKKFVELV